jgi:hypothetical protein
MILSAPVSIEESLAIGASSASRGSTPKTKAPVLSKAIISSKFDSTLPIFPELGVTVSGNAKYEVFMPGAEAGRLREIKVRPPAAFVFIYNPLFCFYCQFVIDLQHIRAP